MLKKIILLFLIQITFIPFANSYYDMSTPVEGESIANDALQFNVIEKIYTTLSPYNPTCSDFKIKNTQILHYPYDVKKKNNKYIKGYWKELWTIDVCGKSTQIPITFYIDKKKTTFNIDEYFLKK